MRAEFTFASWFNTLGFMDCCCTLCDADCALGEALCSACLADPEMRDAYVAVVRIARTRHALVAQYGTARQAIARVREYRREGDRNTRRVRECLAEVVRCRETIRALRLSRTLPGLAKGRPSRSDQNSRRVS